jgi:hypothetical protein
MGNPATDAQAGILQAPSVVKKTTSQIFLSRRKDNVARSVGQSPWKFFEWHEKAAFPVIPDLCHWDTVLPSYMLSTVSLDAAHI